MRRTLLALIALSFGLVMFAAPAPAAERVFTFPDPALVLIRRFDPQKIEILPTGPAPLAYLYLPTSYPIGTEIRVQGTVATLDNGSVIFTEPAVISAFTLEATGAFDQTITLTAPADRLQIIGTTGTSAKITVLTIDVMD